jgi:hypothetical protein
MKQTNTKTTVTEQPETETKINYGKSTPAEYEKCMEALANPDFKEIHYKLAGFPKTYKAGTIATFKSDSKKYGIERFIQAVPRD